MPATLLRRITLATAVAAPALAGAQAGPELRAGRWAAEASVGPGGETGNLLRFTSPTAAWLVGLTFGVDRATDETTTTGPFPGSAEETTTSANVGLRAGYRRYAAAGAALRPITGVGLFGSLLRSESSQSLTQYNTVGAYGELGAVYLFSSRFSVGAAGELRAGYTRQRQESDNFRRRTTGVGVGGSLARVMATVYF